MSKKNQQSEVAEAATSDVKKPALPEETFADEKGNEYKFIVHKFNVPGHGVLTAQEALENAEVLAFLISEKSGVIQLISKGGEK